MDRWEAKRRYAENKMYENSKKETLTKEEHEILADLCSLRHEIHTSWEGIWNNNDVDLLQKLYNFETGDLPKLDISVDIADIPSQDDYFDDLYDDADEYEDLEDWVENSEHYEEFCEIMNKINSEIENYLMDIDKEHGTSYCPTGISRYN